MLRRVQPTTSDGTYRHHSTSRTALTVLTTKFSTATQARRPQDPQDTARYGARQAGRHEHEHCTTELEQHPGAPMGSTGARQGGRRGLATGGGCTYEWHKQNWKDGYRTPQNTG